MRIQSSLLERCVATVTLSLGLAAPAAFAQTVSEIAAPTVSMALIDMDNVGPAGPTTLAAVNAAGTPNAANIQAITMTPTTVSMGIYNTNPQLGRALGLDPSGVGLALIDPQGSFASFTVRIDLAGPSTEIGIALGDWVGPQTMDFYLGGALVTSFTSTSYTSPNMKYFLMSGGQFDSVDLLTGGNWVLPELGIQNLDGLFAGFTATPSSGSTPLLAQFADTSFTSDPGGVTSWAWDLDGDGIVDSTIQNPQFTYNVCGYYDVTLTVTDATHPPSSVTQPGFIQADPQLLVRAGFTSNATGGSPPLTVQFTDASTGTPTSWSWDLDGDGIVDSTIQNPSFTYNLGGGYDVTLSVSNACGSDTLNVPNYIYIVGNDDCSGATPVTFGANGPFQNIGSTTSTPAWPCANGGSDVWFSFTPSCTMNVTIDTCGSGFDTALEIFDGSCALLNSLGCNDDSCGLQSSLDLLPAVGGTTYYIRVGGYSGATGTFVLNLTVGGNGSFSSVATGCGSATLDPNGSPNVGGGISYTMNNVQGTPLIWIGTIPLNNPLCPAGCALGTTFDIVIAAPSIGGSIPCMPFLQGAVFYTQGADLNAQGGCTVPIVPLPMTFTNTVVTTIG